MQQIMLRHHIPHIDVSKCFGHQHVKCSLCHHRTEWSKLELHSRLCMASHNNHHHHQHVIDPFHDINKSSTELSIEIEDIQRPESVLCDSTDHTDDIGVDVLS